jgi:hypothetical protein
LLVLVWLDCGTVRDEHQAVVPTAQAVVTESSKGLVRESLSDASRSFLFPSIGVVYTVRIQIGLKVAW